MEYILWNKNTPVLRFNGMLAYHFNIERITKIENPEYLPFEIRHNKQNNTILTRDVNAWFSTRKIPASRQNLQDLLEVTKIGSTDELALQNYALSLSDQYWISRVGESISWSDINFFTNDFSEDLGKIIGGKQVEEIRFTTPDNTTGGWLAKTWKLHEGKRYLVKGRSGIYNQEPFNEVVASLLCQKLGIDHVPYKIIECSGEQYSACECFIAEDTELVTAYAIIKNGNRPNHISRYDWFLNQCEEKCGLDVQKDIDNILLLDYLILNEDRHYNNFGLIRNVETLEFIGFAPIYDSGTSLFYNTWTNNIASYRAKAKPFNSRHEAQIKPIQYITDNISNLKGIENEIQNILKENHRLERNDPHRKKVISKTLEKRVDSICQAKAMGRADGAFQVSGQGEKNVLIDERTLPIYLKKDIDAFLQGEQDNCSYMDCLYGELQASINVAEWGEEITGDVADSLREKYLGLRAGRDF